MGDKIEGIDAFSPKFREIIKALKHILAVKEGKKQEYKEGQNESVYQQYERVMFLVNKHYLGIQLTTPDAPPFQQEYLRNRNQFERDFCYALIYTDDRMALTQHLYPCLAPTIQLEKNVTPADQKDMTPTRFTPGYAPCLFSPNDSFLQATYPSRFEEGTSNVPKFP